MVMEKRAKHPEAGLKRQLTSGPMDTITGKGMRKRDEILEAADRLFRTHGYEKATMRMIADEANASLGHILHYFHKKDDILCVLLDELIGRIWSTSGSLTTGEDPYAVYAFSHTWFFLTAFSLPDLNRLLGEGLKNHEIQRYFVQRMRTNLVGELERRGFPRDEKRIGEAIVASQSAHFGILLEMGLEAGYEEVVAASKTHIGILLFILGLKKTRVAAIEECVARELAKYSVEDIVAPFVHDHAWYEAEKREVRLGKDRSAD